MRPLRWRRLWAGLAALGIACTGLCSFWPNAAPGLGSVPDKLQHVVGYALFTFFFAGLVRPRYLGRVALVSSALGALIELGQGLTATRTADWHDAAANVLGVTLALVLVAFGGDCWAGRVERLLDPRPDPPRPAEALPGEMPSDGPPSGRCL